MDISKAAGARKEDRDEGVDSSFLVVPASCFDVVERGIPTFCACV